MPSYETSSRSRIRSSTSYLLSTAIGPGTPEGMPGPTSSLISGLVVLGGLVAVLAGGGGVTGRGHRGLGVLVAPSPERGFSSAGARASTLSCCAALRAAVFLFAFGSAT